MIPTVYHETERDSIFLSIHVLKTVENATDVTDDSLEFPYTSIEMNPEMQMIKIKWKK